MNKLTDRVTSLDIINQSNLGAVSWVPSSTFINITLPASGGYITAPADGYFILIAQSNSSGSFIYLDNTTKQEIGSYTHASTSSTLIIGGFVPCEKGDQIWIRYDALSIIWQCCYVYAKGSQDEYVESNT